MEDPFIRMLSALVRCTFPVGCWDKRFVNSMVGRGPSGATEKQKAAIIRLVHKYRRQIPVEIILLAQNTAVAIASGKIA